MHFAKMFMKGKPIKFGYKFWCLCSEDRYLYNFAPYLGKENEPNNEPLGIRVIKNLTSIIPKEEASNDKIFFDNFFTSMEVLKHLGDNSLKATGTDRKNRTKKCPLISSKAMKKTTERGLTDYRFDYRFDVAFVNCWRIHNIVNKDENLTLLEIKRRLTLALLSKTLCSNRHRPGPQKSILRRGRVSEEVRYDSGSHFVAVIQTQRRCAQYGKKVKRICSRYDVPLHDACFETFHTK